MTLTKLKLEVSIQPGLTSMPRDVDSFATLLRKRRDHLRSLLEQARSDGPQEGEGKNEECAWLTRSYPILAVLAPVMSTHEGKVEFPGDPMCLYSALSYSISEVLKARQVGFGEDDPYNDLCPRWGSPPDANYRQSCGDSVIRPSGKDLPNSDQTVFDPRVWNEEVRQYFVEEVLARVKPRVVLISTVSPGHRYAVAMAREIRQCLPTALIVLGGRHVDETMRWDRQTHSLQLAYSSTLRAIDDGRIEPIFDFIISGDGGYALDLLLKAISIAMDLGSQQATVAQVTQILPQLLSRRNIPGQSVIAALEDETIHLFPLHGAKIDLAAVPPPYRFFAIRARFPIFQDEEGRVLRTAHMMTTNACPFRCNFCSEAVSVVGRITAFGRDDIDIVLDRVFEYISYGAESLFFDDSVFWAGSVDHGTAFCLKLAKARREAARGSNLGSPWLRDEAARQRLVQLQWGAQLTAEYMNSVLSHDQALRYLKIMREAGCNYVYMGIESLASAVMTKIHKNLAGSTKLPWSQKVINALEIAKMAGVRVGASVLFGLEGESHGTIAETIQGVARLLDQGLLWIASPNILTYHPGTEITAKHGMADKLDYHSLEIHNRPPYVFFEEAFPSVVSRELTESEIWYIHSETQKRWGRGRNSNPMAETQIPGSIEAGNYTSLRSTT